MRLIIIFFSLTLTFLAVGVPGALASEKRNKLEELLIWKMSDELKLNSGEEKKFTEIITSLNLKKADLNKSLLESIEKMKKSEGKAKGEELSRYRTLFGSYNQIAEDEFDKLRPLLGPERMVQYLLIKQDLTNRLKSMLANPEGTGKTKSTLPSPKMIEEK